MKKLKKYGVSDAVLNQIPTTDSSTMNSDKNQLTDCFSII